MSGHSKFSNIKHKKEAQDRVRSKVFQKYAQEIYYAAKLNGVNPDTNFSLKKAIESAKAVNMPKIRIQKALDRASGKNEFSNAQELTYEAYFNKSVALLIHCYTNNHNRTNTTIKTLLRQNNGQFAALNTFSNIFHREIHIHYNATDIKDFDQFLNDVMSVDIITIEEEKKEDVFIACLPQKFSDLKQVLHQNGDHIISYKMIDVPNFYEELDSDKYENLLTAIQNFCDCDDVLSVSHNAKINE